MSAWSKIWTNIGWQNKPSRLTPLGESNLSKLDDFNDEIDDRVVSLKADKADNSYATITPSQTRTNLADGDDMPTILGKVKKWFADLGTAAFKNTTNTYSGTGTDPITGTGVKAAIDSLDVTGASNIAPSKTIRAWSETDGKVDISTQDISITKSQVSDFPQSMPASDVYAWAKASTKPTYTSNEVGAIATTAKGAANGVAELDANGKIPASQIPGSVDSIVEGYLYGGVFYRDAEHTQAITPSDNKIYVDLPTNLTYRWSGSAYIEISQSLALGETSSTAYRGDRGKIAYDHAVQGNTAGAYDLGFYKIRTAQGHIVETANVGKGDLTALGVADADLYLPLSGGSLTGTIKPSTGNTLALGASEYIFQAAFIHNLYLGRPGWYHGYITFYCDDTSYATTLVATDPTANRVISLPDKQGTIALTSDIPTKTSDLTNDSGYVTTDEKITCITVNPQTATNYSIPFVTDTTNQKPSVDDGFLHTVKSGTTSDVGYSTLKLGNTTASGTNGNKCGILILCSEKSGYAQLRASQNITAGRVSYLPDKDGTIALTSDIPTKTSDLTNDSGYITNSALSSYLPLTGGTLTGNLKVGNPADTSTFPSYGITVHDTRDADHAPGVLQKAVNFFFSHTGTPNSDWWAGMMVRGWTGTGYNSWELVGPASINNQSTTPLYVRTSNGSSWGSWRQIYDSSNKPSFSDLGIGTIGTVNLGSGSSKFLREDGQWTTVTASWSGGQVTSNIYPNATGTLKVGTISRYFSESYVRTAYVNTCVVGYEGEVTGSLYLSRAEGYSAIITAPVLSANVALTLPSASGTLVTDSYLNSNYRKDSLPLVFPIATSQTVSASTWLNATFTVKTGDRVTLSLASTATSGAFSFSMKGSSHGAYASEARNHVNFNSGDQVKTITVDRNEILTVQSYTNTATTFKYVSVVIERLVV